MFMDPFETQLSLSLATKGELLGSGSQVACVVLG